MFVLRETLGEKGEDGRYPTKELGKTVGGVILKMRWRLAKFETNKPSIMSSEYDKKNTDTVVLFGSNEKGLAVDLKEKYSLGSQRVLFADNCVPPVADHEGEYPVEDINPEDILSRERLSRKEEPRPRGRRSSYHHQKPMTWLSGD
jgi:hypothetical protein